VKRRRVLQVVASSRGGGAELIRCLVKGLDPAEFESIIVMPDDGGHVGVTDFVELGASLKRFAFEAGFSLSEFWRLRRLVRGGKFDVIHLHGARAALWGRLAAFGPGRSQIVFGVHGLSIVHYRGLQRRLLVGVERLLSRMTDATLCDSGAERADVLKWKIAKPQRAHVIWNGIDLDRLVPPPGGRDAARAALGLSGNDGVLVTVCRLHKPRDFETLLNGMAGIVRAKSNARLLIVGDGPLRLHVGSLIAQYGLEEHVQLLGLVRNLGEVLAASDVALLITRGWEGLPLAALEAMAMGLPLVISNVGGNSEAVLDGRTGCVIPQGDASALIRAVLDLLENPAKAKQMGKAGAARVREHFNLHIMANKTAEVYRQLLAEAELRKEGCGL
jgi:glycosyltransferase involved in cell wall biosynthesis